MTISRVHEVWCDSPTHDNPATEIIPTRGVQLAKVELRKRGWVCSNDNTHVICPECVQKSKQPRMETVPAPEASILKAFARSPRKVPDETLDRSKPQTRPACICRPVGCGDGGTYAINPNCQQHGGSYSAANGRESR